MLLSVRENIHTMSHNCKYYMKSLKSNAVKSKNIVDLFKIAGQKCSAEEELDSSGEDSENSSDIETNDEVYDGYHFSSLWILNQSIIRGWFSFPRAVICRAWRQSLIHIVNWIFINSQETTATTGVSNLLSKAVLGLAQSDLKGSSSQDLQKRSYEEKERSHLQFYFNSYENEWYCKICSTLAHSVMTATPFVNKAGTFGDHPTHNANRHLQTQCHKDAVSNKLAFDSLS